MLNSKGAGAVSLAGRKPRVITVNVGTIFLPLKLKVISFGFNIEGYVCSRRYCLVLRMSCDLRGTNCGKEKEMVDIFNRCSSNSRGNTAFLTGDFINTLNGKKKLKL